MNRKLVVIAAVLVIAAASIGIGYSYTATTSSESNSLKVNHVSAVNSDGGSFIQVPSVVFTNTGSTYVPEDEAKTATGELTLESSLNSAKVKAWVEFYNPLSWTAIKAITITVDGTEYPCFNSSAAVGSLSTCVPTAVMTLAPGTYDFSINTVFKTAIDVDPSTYTGDNMPSRVVFLMDGDDPMPAA